MLEKQPSDSPTLGPGAVDVSKVKADAEISTVDVALEAEADVVVVAEAVKPLVTWKDVAEEHGIFVAWRDYLLAVYTKGVPKVASLGQKMITTVDLLHRWIGHQEKQ